MGSLALSSVVIQVGPSIGDVPLSRGAVAFLGGVAILVLLGLSAFFSSSEIAMFSLPPHRVESLATDGLPGAGTLQELKDDPHRLLVTILVGNNIVNIAMEDIAMLTDRKSVV